MLNNFSDVMRCISQPKFYLDAFTYYCETKQLASKELLDIIGSSLNIDYDDSIDLTDDLIEQSIDELLLDRTYFSRESVIPTSNGSIYLVDLLHSILYEYNSDVNIDLPAPDIELKPVIPVYDMKEQVKTNSSIADVLQFARSSLQSNVAMTATMIASAATSTADRLTIFRDTVQNSYANAFSLPDVNISYYSSMLQKIVDPADILMQIQRDCGMDQAADDDEDWSPDGSDIYTYSGATPMGSLMLGGVIKGAITAGAKVVKALFDQVGSWLKKGLSKIKSVLAPISGNPVDIYCVDEEGETMGMDRFYVSYSGAAVFSNQNLPYTTDQIDDELNKMKYLSFDLIFGEVRVEIIEVKPALPGSPSLQMWEVKYKTMFKPYPVRAEFAGALMKLLTQGTANPEKINVGTRYKNPWLIDGKPAGILEESKYPSFIQSLITTISQYPDMYYPKDATENQFMSGYHNALALFRLFNDLCLVATETSTSIVDLYVHNFIYDTDQESGSVYDHLVQDEVQFTNADFYSVATGYDSELKEYNGMNYYIARAYQARAQEPIGLGKDLYYPVECMAGLSSRSNLTDGQFVDNPNTRRGVAALYADGFLLMVLCAKLDQRINPIGYTFIPYMAEIQSFKTCKMAIKTDEQLTSEADTVFNVIVAAAIAAAIAVAVAVTVKKLTFALGKKRLATHTAIADKVSKGEKLTDKEFKKYKKTYNKLYCSDSVTSGLQTSSAAPEDDTLDRYFMSVNQLISG